MAVPQARLGRRPLQGKREADENRNWKFEIGKARGGRKSKLEKKRAGTIYRAPTRRAGRIPAQQKQIPHSVRDDTGGGAGGYPRWAQYIAPLHKRIRRARAFKSQEHSQEWLCYRPASEGGRYGGQEADENRNWKFEIGKARGGRKSKLEIRNWTASAKAMAGWGGQKARRDSPGASAKRSEGRRSRFTLSQRDVTAGRCAPSVAEKMS
jgi:hypothetical protein